MEITLTKDNFEQEVLKSNIPVLVDFWASWCGPCGIMGPILSGIAQKYEGKVKVGKVNVDEQGELAGQYNIMSIPTMKLFVSGTQAGEIIGAVPEGELVALLDKHVGK